MKKWKERKKEIGTKNHKKVDGKLLRTDKQFRHLKQRQKETISTWLYEEYRRLWIEKGQEPHKRNNREIVAAVMERIEAAGIWLPEQEVTKYFYRRKTHYRNRIEKELQPKPEMQDTQDVGATKALPSLDTRREIWNYCVWNTLAVIMGKVLPK